jgi:hypothetical protein
VTDPAHPLSGRQFKVLSVSRDSTAASHVLVHYRDGIFLRIPLKATSLAALSCPEPRCKLSPTSIQEVLSLVKECEPCQPSAPRRLPAARRPTKSGPASTRRCEKPSSRS